MLPRGKNGYSWELNSGTQDSEVKFIASSCKMCYIFSSYLFYVKKKGQQTI